jgi:hypothetical protein
MLRSSNFLKWVTATAIAATTAADTSYRHFDRMCTVHKIVRLYVLPIQYIFYYNPPNSTLGI